MKLPVTPKPMPASSPNLLTNHTGKLFGIVYIILTWVIGTIIPAAGPWSWVEKSFSYLLKLAPLLWWALPAKNPAQVIPKTSGLAAQEWIPDIWALMKGCGTKLTEKPKKHPDLQLKDAYIIMLVLF
ncbi:hypothetical protein DSO57_1021504 [Entomophthora muscae]|uniref:Uncharacterized protein n=1 Tax=Entomophthora muscae TaxID=34485 RepID=A0ACC2S5B8_9FUNG|nr:hypothetical protein DSO57_1021504 [Entomophthora muscae]